jgi:hypothetical protein
VQEQGGARRLSERDAGDDLRHAVPWERLASGQQLEAEGAQREQVAAGVQHGPRDLLGRHVARRAPGVAPARDLARGRARDAEVQELRLARLQHHHVAGLDVAMDDAGLVGVVQGARQLRGDAQRLAPARAGALGDDVGQRASLQVLERDEGQVRLLVPPEVVHDHAVGMGDAGGQAGFPQEALLGQAALVERHREGQADDLERDGPVQDGVARAIDDAHRALADLGLDVVAAQERGGEPGKRNVGLDEGRQGVRQGHGPPPGVTRPSCRPLTVATPLATVVPARPWSSSS